MELTDLKELFMTALVKWCNENENKYNFVIGIEGNDIDIFVTGFVYHFYDEKGNFIIREVAIIDFILQFTDFFTNVDRKFINQIIEYCTE